MDENLWSLVSRTVSGSGSIEKAVFAMLAVFSLISWTLILWKICALYETRRNSRRFLTLFDSADCLGTVSAGEVNVGPSPPLAVFKAALHAMETARREPAGPNRPAAGSAVEPRRIPLRSEASPEETVLMSMQHTAKAEVAKLQLGLGFLATVGSTSPFIGLFGTVWGIMNTFRELGTAKSASIAVVAPGISSALIATAAGLAVAIPAVMAYNWFLSQINNIEDGADAFIERMTLVLRGGIWAGYSVAPEVGRASVPAEALRAGTPALPPQPAPRPAPALPVNPQSPALPGGPQAPPVQAAAATRSAQA
jgi:biopolymer transport protein TolQ